MERRGELFLFLAVASICALLVSPRPLSAQYWVMLGGKYVSLGEFEFKIPINWKMRAPIENEIILTRDGLWLQLLRVGRTPTESGFNFTKKKLTKGMPPSQVREVVIDDFRSNRFISNFQVLETGDASVGGFPAFSIVYIYQGDEDVRKMGIYCGSLIDEWYYFLQFQAPSRRYFERDKSAFEEFKNSMASAR